MESLLVQPKNAEELTLLQNLFEKMRICYTKITLEDKGVVIKPMDE